MKKKVTVKTPTSEYLPNKMLSIDRVAELLDCSSRTVQRLSDSGRMPTPVKIGRLIRWRAEDIREWIESGCPRSLPVKRKAKKTGQAR